MEATQTMEMPLLSPAAESMVSNSSPVTETHIPSPGIPLMIKQRAVKAMPIWGAPMCIFQILIPVVLLAINVILPFLDVSCSPSWSRYLGWPDASWPPAWYGEKVCNLTSRIAPSHDLNKCHRWNKNWMDGSHTVELQDPNETHHLYLGLDASLHMYEMGNAPPRLSIQKLTDSYTTDWLISTRQTERDELEGTLESKQLPGWYLALVNSEITLVKLNRTAAPRAASWTLTKVPNTTNRFTLNVNEVALSGPKFSECGDVCDGALVHGTHYEGTNDIADNIQWEIRSRYVVRIGFGLLFPIEVKWRFFGTWLLYLRGYECQWMPEPSNASAYILLLVPLCILAIPGAILTSRLMHGSEAHHRLEQMLALFNIRIGDAVLANMPQDVCTDQGVPLNTRGQVTKVHDTRTFEVEWQTVGNATITNVEEDWLLPAPQAIEEGVLSGRKDENMGYLTQARDDGLLVRGFISDLENNSIKRNSVIACLVFLLAFLVFPRLFSSALGVETVPWAMTLASVFQWLVIAPQLFQIYFSIEFIVRLSNTLIEIYIATLISPQNYTCHQRLKWHHQLQVNLQDIWIEFNLWVLALFLPFALLAFMEFWTANGVGKITRPAFYLFVGGWLVIWKLQGVARIASMFNNDLAFKSIPSTVVTARRMDFCGTGDAKKYTKAGCKVIKTSHRPNSVRITAAVRGLAIGGVSPEERQDYDILLQTVQNKKFAIAFGFPGYLMVPIDSQLVRGLVLVGVSLPGLLTYLSSLQSMFNRQHDY